VLSHETCDELLAYIGDESIKSKAAVERGEVDFDDRFGGVNCRGAGTFGLRQDQFLPVSVDVVAKVLAIWVWGLGFGVWCL
jgi:hypothetical protein